MAKKTHHIPWQPHYELGHEVIDRDHRQLVEIVNRLAIVLEEGHTANSVALMMHFVETARYHFQREERLLQDLGFADLDRHRSYHRRLLEIAERILHECQDARDPETARDGFVELSACLLEDVISGDQEFADLLRDAGMI